MVKVKVLEAERDGVPRAELDAVLASTHDAVTGLTRHGVINEWYPAATWLYGYPAEEIIGHSVEDLATPERRVEAAAIGTAGAIAGAVRSPATGRGTSAPDRSANHIDDRGRVEADADEDLLRPIRNSRNAWRRSDASPMGGPRLQQRAGQQFHTGVGVQVGRSSHDPYHTVRWGRRRYRNDNHV